MAAKVTLKTIAEHTGLSVPTVSQILNGRDVNYSSAATRERVLKAARELHYRPNFGYRLLQGKKTDTAAIVFSSARFFYESKQRHLLLALLDNLNRRGWTAYVNSFTRDEAANTELVRSLVNRGVESFIFYGNPLGLDQIMELVKQSGVNCIGNTPVFDRYVSNGSDLGRQRILFRIMEQVGDDFKMLHFYDTLRPDRAIISSLVQAFPGLTLAELEKRYLVRIGYHWPSVDGDWMENLSVHSREAWRSGFATMEKLLKLPHVPRAVICPSDAFALGCGGCLLSAANAKFRGRILLAGYNNDPTLDNFGYPVISGEDDTLKQAHLLVERCADDTPCRITVPPRLHLRRATDPGIFPGWTDEIEELAADRQRTVMTR